MPDYNVNKAAAKAVGNPFTEFFEEITPQFGDQRSTPVPVDAVSVCVCVCVCVCV